MPLIQIDVGKDLFTDEEKVKIAKEMSKSFTRIFKEIKNREPNPDHLFVLVREPSTWTIGGITGKEYWKLIKEQNDQK